MTVVWIAIGALFGAMAAGFPGLALGAGLGYGLALLIDLRQRLDRMERAMNTRRTKGPETETKPVQDKRVQPRPSPSVTGATPPPPIHDAERYPEETVIDAMLGAERDDDVLQTDEEDLPRSALYRDEKGPESRH